MRSNYVLIDFENLQPELLDALDLPHFRVIVFMGANQTKVPLDFAAMLQRLGTRAQYLPIAGSGRNALDFHVTFYMGELLAKEPDAFFHVIAADKGYDPLLQHLRDRKVLVRRYKSIAEIPHVKAANSKTLSAKVSFVRESLGQRTSGRPATLKALNTTIDSQVIFALLHQQKWPVFDGFRAGLAHKAPQRGGRPPNCAVPVNLQSCT